MARTSAEQPRTLFLNPLQRRELVGEFLSARPPQEYLFGIRQLGLANRPAET